MNESLHLGQVRGIRVGVNWSLLPIFFLITWSLAQTLLPAAAPGYMTWAYWVFGALTTTAFYMSLLAHELAHATVARRHGVSVRGIVLWIFGGVAQLEHDAPDPRAELELTAAGPATSLGLAACGLGAAWLLSQVGASSLLVASVGWLGGINLLLALFNLLPAFPLDGGRILRALLWRRWHDRERATAAAARVGKIGGAVLIGAGVLEALAGAGALDGAWLVLIGWFIIVAAGQQERASLRAGARELRVDDAMTPEPVTVADGITVAEAIERYVRRTRFSAFPVVDRSGTLVGLITVQRMAALPRAQWRTSPISGSTARGREIVQCRADDRLAQVTVRMRQSPDRRAVVVDRGRPVGILTPADVERTVSRAEQQGHPWTAPVQPAGRSGRPATAPGVARGPVPQP